MILLGTFQCSRYVHIIRHAATMYDATRTIRDVHIFILYDTPQYDASRTYACIIPYGTIRHGTKRHGKMLFVRYDMNIYTLHTLRYATVRCYSYRTTRHVRMHSTQNDATRYDAIRTIRKGTYVYIAYCTIRHGTMLFLRYEMYIYTFHTI